MLLLGLRSELSGIMYVLFLGLRAELSGVMYVLLACVITLLGSLCLLRSAPQTCTSLPFPRSKISRIVSLPRYLHPQTIWDQILLELYICSGPPPRSWVSWIGSSRDLAPPNFLGSFLLAPDLRSQLSRITYPSGSAPQTCISLPLSAPKLS